MTTMYEARFTAGVTCSTAAHTNRESRKYDDHVRTMSRRSNRSLAEHHFARHSYSKEKEAVRHTHSAHCLDQSTRVAGLQDAYQGAWKAYRLMSSMNVDSAASIHQEFLLWRTCSMQNGCILNEYHDKKFRSTDYPIAKDLLTGRAPISSVVAADSTFENLSSSLDISELFHHLISRAIKYISGASKSFCVC